MKQAHHPILLALTVLAANLATTAEAGELRLESPSLGPQGELRADQFLDGSGCGGRNVSPALAWWGASERTRSFAVTLFEDSAAARGALHWAVVNIPPTVSALYAGDGMITSARLPPGAMHLRNDFGSFAYSGVCPVADDRNHRYRITIWALDIRSLPRDAVVAGKPALAVVERHAIGSAQLQVWAVQ